MRAAPLARSSVRLSTRFWLPRLVLQLFATRPIEQFRVDTYRPMRSGRYWDAKDYYNNFAFLPEGLNP